MNMMKAKNDLERGIWIWLGVILRERRRRTVKRKIWIPTMGKLIVKKEDYERQKWIQTRGN